MAGRDPAQPELRTMAARPVLIAALSGRALAQSARRAGFIPLVVDAFGDTDTAESAHAIRCLPSAMRLGFQRRTLSRDLAELGAASPEAPIGLVLGAGFEDRLPLLAHLGRSYRLLGCAPQTVERVKDPAGFSSKLGELGIAHPVTRFDPTFPDGDDWLSKRRGATGGLHIRTARASTTVRSGRYLQRRVGGKPVSILALATHTKTWVIGVTQQWINPTRNAPFRYGGAIGPIQLPETIQNRLTQIAMLVCPAFDLRGLVSLDFIVADDAPYLLEINPRPGATLDILDDETGALFATHVQASLGTELTHFWQPSDPAREMRASAYLYADRGPIKISAITWPSWSADRPSKGTLVSAGAPIATVFAAGADETAARARLSERLAHLGEMLYGRLPK